MCNGITQVGFGMEDYKTLSKTQANSKICLSSSLLVLPSSLHEATSNQPLCCGCFQKCTTSRFQTGLPLVACTVQEGLYAPFLLQAIQLHTAMCMQQGS